MRVGGAFAPFVIILWGGRPCHIGGRLCHTAGVCHERAALFTPRGRVGCRASRAGEFRVRNHPNRSLVKSTLCDGGSKLDNPKLITYRFDRPVHAPTKRRHVQMSSGLWSYSMHWKRAAAFKRCNGVFCLGKPNLRKAFMPSICGNSTWIFSCCLHVKLT